MRNTAKNDNLNTNLKQIFTDIESFANGVESEKNIKDLFADFDITSNRLGNTVADKNKRLTSVLKGVADLDFAHNVPVSAPPNKVDGSGG